MVKKEWLLIIILLSSIQLVLSLPNDANSRIDFTYSPQTNYSLINVNNSQFLQSLTPTQVANLFTELDPVYLADKITYSPFWYNGTIGAINQGQNTFLNLSGTNANQNMNIRNWNFTTNGTISSTKLGVGTTKPRGVLQSVGGDVYFGDENNTARYVYFLRNGVVLGGLSTASTLFSFFGGANPSKTHVVLDTSGHLLVNNAGSVQSHLAALSLTLCRGSRRNVFRAAPLHLFSRCAAHAAGRC
jgi:hypothetical protein